MAASKSTAEFEIQFENKIFVTFAFKGYFGEVTFYPILSDLNSQILCLSWQQFNSEKSIFGHIYKIIYLIIFVYQQHAAIACYLPPVVL